MTYLEDKKMEVFISWSGDRSKKIAELLKGWLPKVMQNLNPWMSASDIYKGTRWLKEISEKLESVNYGIICLTPENLDEKWILFEAGALSKTIDASFVCPILFELNHSSVEGPLSQFQATSLTKVDMKSLIETLNERLGNNKLSDQHLKESFEMWWPELEKEVSKIPPPTNKVGPERTNKSFLVEILQIVRGIERNSAGKVIDKDKIKKILATLTPKEEKVLRMRFGLDDNASDQLYKNMLRAIFDGQDKT